MARSSPKRSTRETASTPCSPSTCPATTTTGTPCSRASPTTPPTALPWKDWSSRKPSPVSTRSAPSMRSARPMASATRSKPGTRLAPTAASPPARPPAAPAPGRERTSTPWPVPVVEARRGSLPSGPPTRPRPEARAISMTARPACMRHSASTGRPRGPVTRVRRTEPPSASSSPSPPSATGARSQVQPAPAAALAMASATWAAVAVPRNLSGAATTCATAPILPHGPAGRPRQDGRVRPTVAESQLNQLIVASNRGPLAFERGPSGTLVPGRGGGGLVASLGPALAGTGATWAAGAISRGDRQAAGGGPIEAEGFWVQLLDLPAPQYRQFYNVVSNATLWFLYHGLFDHA